MSVTATSFQIYNSGANPTGSPFSLYRYGREGVRMSGSNPAVFTVEDAGSGANKIISGTVTSINGGRVTFPSSFTYRCYGLSVQHLDDLGVNWDYNSGYHGGEVTIVYASGTYDASGFTLYSNFSYLSGVSELNGNFSFCYTAWGI
jgi:hypothetical protein